jgi:hypothetical protein
MATGDAGGDHGNSSAVVDLEVTGALSGFHSRKGLSAMATAKMLVDTARYTVVRQNGGSIEIAPKDNPKGTRLFHRQAERYEGESIAAYYRNGFVGVDRLCARLLADAGYGARRVGSGRLSSRPGRK